MKAEQFIKDCTRGCSNELRAVEDKYGKKITSYHEWLTPSEHSEQLRLKGKHKKKNSQRQLNLQMQCIMLPK